MVCSSSEVDPAVPISNWKLPEPVVSRRKNQGYGMQLGALHTRPANGGGGPDRVQVLGHEAGPGAARPNVGQAHRLSGKDRERQGTPQNLSPTFALRAVDMDHTDTLS